MMKRMFLLAALATAAMGAQAGVVCDSCDYQASPSVASNLGLHNPNNNDNSTFSNATTGTNGDFSNWWIFDINPNGETSVNAIFLPIRNIANFDVQLYTVDSAVCNPNSAIQSGACSALDVGSLVADGDTNPVFATAIDFVPTNAGKYAFNVTGTILNLGATQPASYTGNLQVQAIPEPGTLLLTGMGLLGLGLFSRKLRD